MKLFIRFSVFLALVGIAEAHSQNLNTFEIEIVRHAECQCNTGMYASCSCGGANCLVEQHCEGSTKWVQCDIPDDEKPPKHEECNDRIERNSWGEVYSHD